MNRFDRSVIKRTNELIEKNIPDGEVYEEDFKKYMTIARAMIREEMRNLKPSNKTKSLYNKTWKAADKYGDFTK